MTNSARSSLDSTSTTSLILERVNQTDRPSSNQPYDDPASKETFSDDASDDYDPDVEAGKLRKKRTQSSGEKKIRRWVIIIGAVLIGTWAAAFVYYISTESYRDKELPAADVAPTVESAPVDTGKKVTLDQIMGGVWRPNLKPVKWVEGEKDGLMIVTGSGEGYVVVHDVKDDGYKKVLMKDKRISYDRLSASVEKFWPSRDLKHLLLATDVQSVGIPRCFSVRSAGD